MVPPVTVAAAGVAFFFHVDDFAAGGDFTIAPDDAAAAQSSEAKKPNETHLTPSVYSLSNSHAAQFECRARYEQQATPYFTYRLY
jgi:hypothetical protein